MSKGGDEVDARAGAKALLLSVALALVPVTAARAQGGTMPGGTPAPGAPPSGTPLPDVRPRGAPRTAPEPGSKTIRYVSAQAYFQAMRAELLAARGDLDGAAEALALALVYDPESYHLHVALARVALGLGRGARVDRLVDQAIRMAPRRAAAWRLRGDAARADGRPDEAVRAYTRAVALEPDSADGVDAAIALAGLEEGRGREGRAREILAKASERAPRAVEALVRFETERGALEAASAAAERGWARFPDQAVLARIGIEAHVRAGRFERAWAMAAVAAVAEDAPAETLVTAHAVATMAGHHDAAAVVRARLEERTPSAEVRARMGLALVAGGRVADAQAVLAAGRPGAAAQAGPRGGAPPPGAGAPPPGAGAPPPGAGAPPPGAGAPPPGAGAQLGAAGPVAADTERPRGTRGGGPVDQRTAAVDAEPGAARVEEARPPADVLLGAQTLDEVRARLGRALWVAGDHAGGGPLLAATPEIRLGVQPTGTAGVAAESRRWLASPSASLPVLIAAATALARTEGPDAALAALGPIGSAARAIAAAEVEATSGRLEAAVARLEAARTLDPKGIDRASAHVQARFGSVVRAERIAERLAQAPDADPGSVALLGQLRAARRARLPESIARVVRALGHAPDDAALLGAQGRLLIAAGREADGARALARAVWIDGTDPVLLEHWADARLRAGDGSGARETYQRAVAELTVRVGIGEPGAEARRARVADKLAAAR